MSDELKIPSSQVLVKQKKKLQKPKLFKVILLNDDYTPMEFVVLILQRFFGHNTQTAQKIMLHVHQKGVGVCGVSVSMFCLLYTSTSTRERG